MFEKVQTILAKQLRLDPAKITPESLIKKDLGADSLDILQLLMRIQCLFYRVADSTYRKYTNFGCWLLAVGCWLLAVGCWRN